MIKTFPGTSINYGQLLPPGSAVADGSLFFKTNFDTDGTSNPPGLYMYGFRFDTNTSLVGDQVGQGWRIASDLTNYVLKSGGPMTGALTFAAVPGPAITIQSVSPGIRLTETDQGVGSKDWLLVADGATFQIQTRDDSFNSSSTVFSVNRAGAASLSGQTIWTAGNDGAGSTMDADLLDGQHGSYYLSLANSTGSLDINSRTSGALSISRGGTNNTVAVQGGVLYGASPTQLAYTPVGTAGQLLQSSGAGQPTWVSPSLIPSSTASTLATSREIALSGDVTGTVMFDGSSNVTMSTTVSNSAKLSNLSPSASAVPNTIAQRDGTGYLFAAYLNQGSGNSENPTISQVMVTNGADGFLRKASISALASAVSTAGLSGYVSKLGDTMTGSLTVGDQAGEALTVNGITLSWSGSAISTSGSITGGSLTTANAVSAGSASITGNTVSTRFRSENQGSLGDPTFAFTLNGVPFGGLYAVYPASPQATIRLAAGGSAFQFGFSGSFTAPGDVIAYSDRRIKRDIATIENALYKVNALRGVDFNRLDGTPGTGVIAQEVQEVIPSVVHESSDGTLGVAYGNLVGVLIEAIKEQQKQIDELTSRLNALID